jgi:heat shock protein HtpX
MDNLFSTHPDTENRIAALEAMAAEFGSSGSGRPQASARPAPEPRGQAAPPSGPWGGRPAETPEPQAPEPEADNPWGRSPTGPRVRRQDPFA